ncbi:hypothetical protein PG997_010922 [Apiospora hydei]|uniref:Uncharacterized protein n=1 Tax=Apiospora hydei TaxID=1337664 RepID=A0ABR1VHM1_9PEZI
MFFIPHCSLSCGSASRMGTGSGHRAPSKRDPPLIEVAKCDASCEAVLQVCRVSMTFGQGVDQLCEEGVRILVILASPYKPVNSFGNSFCHAESPPGPAFEFVPGPCDAWENFWNFSPVQLLLGTVGRSRISARLVHEVVVDRRGMSNRVGTDVRVAPRERPRCAVHALEKGGGRGEEPLCRICDDTSDQVIVLVPQDHNVLSTYHVAQLSCLDVDKVVFVPILIPFCSSLIYLRGYFEARNEQQAVFCFYAFNVPVPEKRTPSFLVIPRLEEPSMGYSFEQWP